MIRIFLVFWSLFLSVIAYADDVQVTRDQGSYYLTRYSNEKVTDIDGIEHIVPGDPVTEVVTKDQLISELTQIWGNDEDTQKRIVTYIQKLDTEPSKPFSQTQSSAPQSFLFAVEREYGSFLPYVLDLRRAADVDTGVPLNHDYKCIYHKEMKDINGVSFTMVAGTTTVVREELEQQKAEAEKNLNSPLAQVYDKSKIDNWKNELAQVEPILNKIYEFESRTDNEQYINENISLTIGGIKERIVPHLVGTEKHLYGVIRNNGDRSIVNVELTVSFLDGEGKTIEERVYVLPTDSGLQKYNDIDEQTLEAYHRNTDMPIPDDLFSFFPNSQYNFEFKIAWPVNTQSVKARVSYVVFKEQFIQWMNEYKGRIEKELTRARTGGEMQWNQNIINGINQKINEVGGSSIDQAKIENTIPQSLSTITINIPNSKGGYTPVIFKKQNDGYIGPRGESYKTLSVYQLKKLYGN